MQLFERVPETETAALRAETLLLPPASKRFVVLNRTASCLWSSLVVPCSELELIEAILAAFRVEERERQRVHAEVRTALDELVRLGCARSIER